MSKGSGRRPQKAKDDYVSSEWERLFGDKKPAKKKKPPKKT